VLRQGEPRAAGLGGQMQDTGIWWASGAPASNPSGAAQRPQKALSGRAMAVVVGGEHWQSRAKRAAASAAAPCPASADRALLPLYR
jgi:hypothetical protein